MDLVCETCLCLFWGSLSLIHNDWAVSIEADWFIISISNVELVAACRKSWEKTQRHLLTIPLRRANTICRCTCFQIRQQYWQCDDIRWQPNVDQPHAELLDCRAALSAHIFDLSRGSCIAPPYRWCRGQALYSIYRMHLWLVWSSVDVVNLLIRSIAW